jgi:hypothetical protein
MHQFPQLRTSALLEAAVNGVLGRAVEGATSQEEGVRLARVAFAAVAAEKRGAAPVSQPGRTSSLHYGKHSEEVTGETVVFFRSVLDLIRAAPRNQWGHYIRVAQGKTLDQIVLPCLFQEQVF